MLIINDTNIWIDLKFAGLLDKVFMLPYDIGVPNILFEEELQEQDGEILKEKGIKILEMTDEEVLETSQMSTKTKKVSFNDLTTLVVAHKRNHILVTGDGNLRILAKEKNVELRGSIWIIDELVRNKIICSKKVARVCKNLLDSNRRLPKAELEKRIKMF